MFHVKTEDVFLDYFGLNHLSFVRKVFVNGKDVTDEAFSKLPVSEDERRIVEYLGMFPNYYLRYYYLRQEMVEEIKAKPKRAEEVLKIEQGCWNCIRILLANQPLAVSAAVPPFCGGWELMSILPTWGSSRSLT